MISLVDGTNKRMDNDEMKMVTLYQLPSITSVKLYARAHLVNGTYPRYPELEFVEVQISNPNGVKMDKLPVKCRTQKLHFALNTTWIDDYSLV